MHTQIRAIFDGTDAAELAAIRVGTSGVEISSADFEYHPAEDAFTCPVGKVLKLTSLSRTAHSLYWTYRASAKECQLCPLQSRCISESRHQQGRIIQRS